MFLDFKLRGKVKSNRIIYSKGTKRFLSERCKGLQSFEKIMPALIAAQSYACIRSNSKGSLHYTGAALPFPLQSKSEFGSLDSDINDEELTKKSKEIQDKTEQKKKKLRRRQMKQKSGHGERIAVTLPRFVCTRAHSRHARREDNPFYNSVETWSFGVPYARSGILQRREVQEVIGGLPEKKGTIQPVEKFFTNI